MQKGKNGCENLRKEKLKTKEERIIFGFLILGRIGQSAAPRDLLADQIISKMREMTHACTLSNPFFCFFLSSRTCTPPKHKRLSLHFVATLTRTRFN